MQPEAFFLPAGDGTGERFCLYHAPDGERVRGLVLYVHPFAEEMNKSRRMAALQSRALSKAGYGVLQIDLLGCGDSSGDFGDATWQAWIDDVLLGCNWLQKKAQAPLWLWGLRAGCLVAVEAARQRSAPCSFLFWQPVIHGKAALQQFLRLKTAADVAGGAARGAMAAMRSQLAAGASVEVAGYALSAPLANGLERATLTPPLSSKHLAWVELSARNDATLPPASQSALDQWGACVDSMSSRVINGPSFWQTSEIEEAPELSTASLTAMRDAVTA